MNTADEDKIIRAFDVVAAAEAFRDASRPGGAWTERDNRQYDARDALWEALDRWREAL